MIEYLDWIISELEKRPKGTVYLDHESFDEPIVMDIEKAIQLRKELENDK